MSEDEEDCVRGRARPPGMCPSSSKTVEEMSELGLKCVRARARLQGGRDDCYLLLQLVGAFQTLGSEILSKILRRRLFDTKLF